MNEIQKLINDLVDNVANASLTAQELAFLTNDVDMQILSLLLRTLLTASANGDLVDLAEVISKFLESKNNASPVQDLSREAIRNSINLN